MSRAARKYVRYQLAALLKLTLTQDCKCITMGIKREENGGIENGFLIYQQGLPEEVLGGNDF